MANKTNHITFYPPQSFSGEDADKLFRGLRSRFRFNSINVMFVNHSIDITYSEGNNPIANNISDFVNGFCTAL